METNPKGCIYTTCPAPRAQETLRKKGAESLEEPEDQGVCWGTVSSRGIGSYTHKVPPAGKPKLESNESSRHAKVDRKA